MNTTLFSSYRLHDNTVADYIAELNRLTPVYIDSYPSSIYHIAEASRRKGIAITARPKVVVTSSEMLSPDQRWAIETAFECPVRDQYGCAEMVGWLGQCEQGSYHSSPEYGLFEVIRDDGTACSPGEVGNVCLTGFVNPLMPVLRYLIGDRAAISDKACRCGRQFPVILGLDGRDDDVLITPSGRRVGRVALSLKFASGFRDAQIIQDAVDHVVVRVVPDDNANLPDFTIVVRDLQERLGPDMGIGIQFVDEVEREASGKFRVVKRLVPREPPLYQDHVSSAP